MCNIGKAISRAFTPPGTGALLAEEEQAQQQAQAATNSADAALTAALQQAQQASLPASDNPSALAAARAQNQRLLMAQGSAWSFGGAPVASPATATRILFGA